MFFSDPIDRTFRLNYIHLLGHNATLHCLSLPVTAPYIWFNRSGRLSPGTVVEEVEFKFRGAAPPVPIQRSCPTPPHPTQSLSRSRSLSQSQSRGAAPTVPVRGASPQSCPGFHGSAERTAGEGSEPHQWSVPPIQPCFLTRAALHSHYVSMDTFLKDGLQQTQLMHN